MKKGYFVSQVGFNFFGEEKETRTEEDFVQLSNNRLIGEINSKLKGTDAFLAIGIIRNTLKIPVAYKDVQKKSHPISFENVNESVEIVPKHFISLCEMTVNALKEGEQSYNQRVYNILMAEME